VTLDEQAREQNGEARPWWARPGKLEHFTTAHEPAVDRGTQLADVASQQVRRGPGSPGGWNRFLLAHLRWILLITLVVVGAAGAWAHHQTPMYTSTADVNVWFASPDPTAVQGPNMVTEKTIVSSGVVLAIADRELGVPASELLHGLSVSVPASSSIMAISYSDPVPWIARERAQVIAQAYVAYRTPKGPAPAASAKTSPASQVATLRATVITAAELPTAPSSPKYLIDILAALIVGLALSIGTAAVRDRLDDRCRGPADLEEQTGTPVLGLVPSFLHAARDPASSLTLTRHPDSVVAEAYRSLRTRVTTAAATRGAKTLLVTSPGWEAKGMIAANLAVALAQSGRRTVLVCADLRWGTASEPFGAGNGEGLTTVLSRRADLATAVRHTSIRGLSVLPAGPLPPDPAELIQRPALRTVLGEIRGQCDFVVIEAPPILATPDARPLAHVAEMILLVSDARKSTRTQLRAALRELEDAAAKLVGSVLYNVGRRRWLGRSSAPDATFEPAGPGIWSQPDPADSHEVTPSLQPTKHVDMTAGPRGSTAGEYREGGYEE
jgi:polysaccharide biosynthesis transport protein